MFAIPNGAWLPWKVNRRGKRYSPEAIKLKDEGLKSGVPDIFLPCPVGSFAGLFIEMKFGDNKPSIEQAGWIAALKVKGYYVEVVWGWEAAVAKIKEYLDGSKNGINEKDK
jgi:hypothetical protein